MHVAALTVHPVKSLRGTAQQALDVEPWGPAGDRRWMLVDDDGALVSARTVPELLRATARETTDGGLLLRATGRTDLLVPRPASGPVVAVGLSRVGTAVDAGGAAHDWLSAVAGRPVRLVWLDDPRRRPMSAGHGGRPGDVLSLADTGPLLLASAASLRQLDRWAAGTWADRYASCGAAAGTRPAPLAMERFRPNVVVDGEGLAPFVEDGWDEVVLGDVPFRVAELCDRCVLTTLDPATGVRTPEPLRSLSKHRRWDGAVWFGVRLVPLAPGRVRVGDPVRAASVAGSLVRGRRPAPPLAGPAPALVPTQRTPEPGAAPVVGATAPASG